MEESRKNPETTEPEEKKTPQFRGLYEHVHISVRTLDIIIVCCVLVIVAVLAIELSSPGFVVTFDSTGGTDVPTQTQMYGEKLKVPEPPTREGYDFAGWYRDPACYDIWSVEVDEIQEATTLYAKWVPKTP